MCVLWWLSCALPLREGSGERRGRDIETHGHTCEKKRRYKPISIKTNITLIPSGSSKIPNTTKYTACSSSRDKGKCLDNRSRRTRQYPMMYGQYTDILELIARWPPRLLMGESGQEPLVIHPREQADLMSDGQWLLLLTAAIQSRVEAVVLLTRKWPPWSLVNWMGMKLILHIFLKLKRAVGIRWLLQPVKVECYLKRNLMSKWSKYDSRGTDRIEDETSIILLS